MPHLSDSRMFAALGSRNFRLYFFGQCCALTGSWMQRVAMAWMVMHMDLENAGARMGLVEFANQAPVFGVGLFVGVFLDRYDLRKVLIGTQLSMICHSLSLALLIYTSLVGYIPVLFLSFLLGIIAAIDMPARQASITQMIDHPKQLQSALSLQSGSFNLARLVGPAIAGFVIQAGGEIACFILNAVAHLAVLYAYCIMRLPARKLASRTQPARDALREGFRYTRQVTPIRLIILFNYLFCMVGVPYIILMPMFAKQALDGDSRHLGFLFGGVGLGALAGVMYIAARINAGGLPRHVCRMQLCFGLSYLAFAFIGDWRLAVALSPILGFTIVSALVSNNSLVQALVDEDKRGRVLSLNSFGILGFGPLGGLLFGKLADHTDVRVAAVVCGVSCVCVALLHFRRLKEYHDSVPAILASKGLC